MLFPTQTPILVALDILLIAAIFGALYPVYFLRVQVPRWRVVAGIICAFLFCMFSFWGTDWFHYQDLFINLTTYTNFKTHLEDVYIFLIKDVCPNYYAFRLIVWGSALYLFHLTIKRLELEIPLAWFFFGTLFLPIFAYARVSLAIAVLMYGTVLVARPYPTHRIFSTLIGIGLILCSFFFHKSAIIGIAIVIFSYSVRDASKNSWFYILLGFLVCAIAAKFLIQFFIHSDFEGEAEFTQKSQSYIGREVVSKTTGIGAILRNTIELSTYYLAAYLSFRIQNNYIVAKGIDLVLRINFYLVLFASLFSFDTGANTSIFYGRVLRFTLIPTTIILCYSWQHKLFPKLIKSIVIVGLINNLYKLFYSLYISAVT